MYEPTTCTLVCTCNELYERTTSKYNNELYERTTCRVTILLCIWSKFCPFCMCLCIPVLHQGSKYFFINSHFFPKFAPNLGDYHFFWGVWISERTSTGRNQKKCLLPREGLKKLRFHSKIAVALPSNFIFFPSNDKISLHNKISWPPSGRLSQFSLLCSQYSWPPYY